MRGQAERRQQAAALLGTLEGLWDVLDTADDDVDRRKFEAMLDGPMRVHTSTFIKVQCYLLLMASACLHCGFTQRCSLYTSLFMCAGEGRSGALGRAQGGNDQEDD